MALYASSVADGRGAALHSKGVQQLTILTFDLLSTLIIGCVFPIIFERRVKVLIRRVYTILQILLVNFGASLLAQAEQAENINVLASMLLLNSRVHHISNITKITLQRIISP